MLRRFRSAITGRYTTPADAQANPASTVSEPASTITFHSPDGTRLDRWSVRAGMTITGTEYSHHTGALKITVVDDQTTWPGPLPLT